MDQQCATRVAKPGKASDGEIIQARRSGINSYPATHSQFDKPFPLAYDGFDSEAHMSDFILGDRVIYPNHGLGVVESVHFQDFGQGQVKVYHLRLQETNSKVMVPISNAIGIGIRKIVTREAADAVIKNLYHSTFPRPENARDWKVRFKENTEKMKSGLLEDVADVFLDLSRVGSRKALSYREKKMYDRARKLLVSEIAAVQDLTEARVEEEVDHILVDFLEIRVIRDA